MGVSFLPCSLEEGNAHCGRRASASCDVRQRVWDESQCRVSHLSDCGSTCVEYRISFNSTFRYNLVTKPHRFGKQADPFSTFVREAENETAGRLGVRRSFQLQPTYLSSGQRRRIGPLWSSVWFFWGSYEAKALRVLFRLLGAKKMRAVTLLVLSQLELCCWIVFNWALGRFSEKIL